MKEKKKTGLIIVLAAILMLLIIGGSVLTFATIDETNSVHIRAKEIENSTLIVGTHLIYLGAMNDQNYEIAMASVSEAAQYKRYYKSELADGTWYDVTDAGTLADITTAGRIVEVKEIEALFMTHHTKSDGITYDLRTGKSVSIFDIKDPYDLGGLSEMEPIKLQYDVLMQTADPTETNQRDRKLIEEVYAKDRQNEVTKECDQSLDKLYTYYEILVQNDADSAMSEMVMSVMEKIDARRRAELLFPLQDGELENLNRVAGRAYDYLAGEVTEGWKAQAGASEEAGGTEEAEDGRKELEKFSLNTDLLTAIGQAISNVQESYIEDSSKMLEEGTTVLSQAEYTLSMQLAQQAAAENFSGCDETVKKLIYLDRINNGVIQEEDAERAFIEGELLPKAESAYRSSLSAGAGEAYQTLSSTAAAATKANALKQQKNDAEIVRNEFQFILRAYMDRMAAETAMEQIAQRIEDCDHYRIGIKADDYESYAQSSVDAHLEWLQQTMNDLQNSLGNRTMDHLMEQKSSLQTERMTALDKNQLSVAKKLEAQIAGIDQEMEDMENHLNAILHSESTSASEKARAAAQLGERNASAALQEMKNGVLENLRSGDLKGVENVIDGIGALAGNQPESALGALKDIYKELSNQGLSGGGNTAAVKELLEKVEEVTAEQMSHFIGDLSQADMEQLIRSFVEENSGSTDAQGLLEAANLSELMNELSDDMMAVVLAGLNMYGDETGSSAAKKLVADYGRIAFGDANLYVFEKFSGEQGVKFAPTDRIGRICGYRYIFNNSQKAVTLQEGSQYYKFTAFSALVTRGGTIEDMSQAAEFQRVIYLPEDAAKGYFSLDTEYLTNTSYGVLLKAEQKEKGIAFLDYLLEAGGEF